MQLSPLSESADRRISVFEQEREREREFIRVFFQMKNVRAVAYEKVYGTIRGLGLDAAVLRLKSLCPRNNQFVSVVGNRLGWPEQFGTFPLNGRRCLVE